jgi:probable rRNA maturation factor
VSVSVEIVQEAGDWTRIPGAGAAIRRAAEATLAGSAPAEIGVVLADDTHMRALNRAWRGEDKATNVLSFPSTDRDAGPRLLGDLVFALETIEREAGDAGKPPLDHLTHLAVHGILHLLGFDHARDEDAETMEAHERALLAGLGIPDPYPETRNVRKQPA